eukprot:4322994-Pyramimonas_sp.AAC.1
MRHGQIWASWLLWPSMCTCLCRPGHRRPSNWSRISGAFDTSSVAFLRMPPAPGSLAPRARSARR